MQLNVKESARTPLSPGRRRAFRGFGAFALGAMIAALLVVASPGRISAAGGSFTSAHSGFRVQAMTTPGMTPKDTSSADTFMQAIISHNGQLAWQQLCPALQAKVPVTSLVNLMNSDKAESQGVQLRVDVVGTHAWSDGGAIHVYVVTAHKPTGADARMLIVLRTQASGCVDGILSA